MIILTGNPDLQLKKPDNKNIFLWIIFLRAKQDTASNALISLPCYNSCSTDTLRGTSASGMISTANHDATVEA